MRNKEALAELVALEETCGKAMSHARVWSGEWVAGPRRQPAQSPQLGACLGWLREQAASQVLL